MKGISTILAALLCGTAPFAAAPSALPSTTAEQSETRNLQLGKEKIAQIRAAYEKGEYDDFLAEMEESYQSAQSENQLAGLIETRLSVPPEEGHKKWNDFAAVLKQQKNQEMLSAVSPDDKSIYAEKARSAAAVVVTPEQEKAIEDLAQYRYMAPGMGKDDDENKIIEIGLASEYKAIHLDRPMSGMSPQEQREKQVVLKMERMDQLVEASKKFKSGTLKKVVELNAQKFDERTAQAWDVTDINALAKGKIKPENETEKKIASIHNSYQGKLNDLAKDYFEKNGQFKN